MDYSYSTQMLSAMIGMYFGLIMVIAVVALVMAVLSIIGYWKVFKKAS